MTRQTFPPPKYLSVHQVMTEGTSVLYKVPGQKQIINWDQIKKLDKAVEKVQVLHLSTNLSYLHLCSMKRKYLIGIYIIGKYCHILLHCIYFSTLATLQMKICAAKS